MLAPIEQEKENLRNKIGHELVVQRDCGARGCRVYSVFAGTEPDDALKIWASKTMRAYIDHFKPLLG